MISSLGDLKRRKICQKPMFFLDFKNPKSSKVHILGLKAFICCAIYNLNQIYFHTLIVIFFSSDLASFTQQKRRDVENGV